MRALWLVPAFLALAACQPKPAPEDKAEREVRNNNIAIVDAAAQPPGNLSVEALDLADCAAAFAAVGGIDPGSTRNDASTRWFQEFAAVQMAVMTLAQRPDPQVMSHSIDSRLEHWKAEPPAAQKARAEACAAKY